MTYSWLLLLHGALRWLVLIAGVLAILRAWQGKRRASWNRLDERTGIIFISLLDTQLLLGVYLYAISPIRVAAYAAPGSTLVTEMGFFAFLHPALMVAAIIVAHVGKALAKRAAVPVEKQSRLLACFLAALILMALAIPWWRPFLRL
jgi:hypothetical protein